MEDQEHTARHGADLARVAALNEACKVLLERSFHVNLRALDAIVQSKRAGAALRGFDEVAGQMRTWSRDLHHELERLVECSRRVVVSTSLAAKNEQSLRLLSDAARLSSNAGAVRVRDERIEELASLDRNILRLWREARDLLHDLDQLGMMAAVLSRSAMIEAASGSDEQRGQLGEVAREFYSNAQAVLETLQDAVKIARREET
jgi:hypothetical protein